MGYLTRYSLDADKEFTEAIRSTSKGAAYAFRASGGGDEARKWYDWKDEFAAVCHDLPDCEAVLHGQGEEAHDEWQARNDGGKMQIRKVVRTWGDWGPP